MLVLHNKDFTTKYGAINSVIEAFVEEERNGLFELSFIMLNTDSLFNYVKEDNIVVANANDTLLNQKFRIYMTRKLMNNRVEVFARHISFDLMYDYIDSVSFENQSCEYALNQLFRSSQFSKNYKGYSDIINAQNYNISMANVLEAIGGKEGSILDTFGTGAELLRDNENIHVLNKRGHDNSVSIEYKKNLTGFELEEDTTDLITRILPYAKYTPKDEEGNSLDEVIVKASFVDSSLIANYSHPFISAIDYTDKFEEDEEVTADKLKALAELEYKDNKVDRPKQNFKIEFIPLSKCVGYETLSDNISLCDTVTILDTRYNINTQAKVIKTTFNVLKNRYESIELGEPKTTLGDIVGSNDSSKGEKGDKGDKGDKGEDGNIGDFPNSLPSTPNVTTKVYGFSNIEISWTFDDKVYYQYEVYTSKESNFTPNTFNLVHKGQTSNYMYQAKPNETWYFKVCCINTHGERTDFGSAYATTVKVDDLSNYVGEMAIDNALIGTLNLDRGWVGTLKGNYIDAKQLSVTDGNGKRTLDIDSYGNINLFPTEFKLLVNGKEENVVTNTELKALENRFEFNFEQTGSDNLISNSSFDGEFKAWNLYNTPNLSTNTGFLNPEYGKMISITSNSSSEGIYQEFKTIKGQVYTVSFYSECHEFVPVDTRIGIEDVYSINLQNSPRFKRHSFTFTATKTSHTFIAYVGYGCIYLGRIMVTKGDLLQEYRKANNEIYGTNTAITPNGIEVFNIDGSKAIIDNNEITFTATNGRKSLAIENGGMSFYNYLANEKLGVMKPSIMNNNQYLNGISLSTEENGDYIEIGGTLDDKFTPSVIFNPNGHTEVAKGVKATSFHNVPVHFDINAMFNDEAWFNSGVIIPSSYVDGMQHRLLNREDNKLIIAGQEGFELGYWDNKNFVGHIGKKRGQDGVFYGNWDFLGGWIYNVNISQSYNLGEIKNIKLLNEDYAEVKGNNVTVDTKKAMLDIYKKNIELKEENETLKGELFKLSVVALENAFEIANMELRGL